MNAAISTMSYSNPFTVLTCVFHLFDMNVKKKVLPVLAASGKGSSLWAGFRKDLGIIHEASDLKVLEENWEDLLEEWIPLSDRTRNVRNYMYNYVWCKKKSGLQLTLKTYLLVVL